MASLLSGRPPDNLGAKNGRLAPCKRSPNCVSSQADRADAEHYIAPIAFKGTTVEAVAAAKRAIEAVERATIMREERGFLYAEFRSKLLGFVDDLELLYDERAGVFHVRSASRLGRRDFGVNRARVEKLRALIAAPR
jgi:uncharacterized protein (DUF1499 family)